MSMLLKNDVRKYMYEGRFKNKTEFWNDVVAKRLTRVGHYYRDLKKEKGYKKPNYINLDKLRAKYLKLIPKENLSKLEDILLSYAVGIPSFYDVSFVAGSPNARYIGTRYFDGYSKSCGYTAKCHDFVIYVPRVLTIEVKEFEGLYNLHCKKIKKIKDVIVYEAVWIVKHRGFNFEVVKGFISENGITSFHANTIKESLKGLANKSRRAINKMIKKDTIITVSKFRKITGACETGCKNWLNNQGIDESIKMKVSEAIEFLQNRGQGFYADKLIQHIK